MIKDPTKICSAKQLLELRLRQVSGDAFQSFFDRIMKARHSSDFVSIRAYKGDRGCDGFRLSEGRLFACYGPRNDGKTVPAAKIAEKMSGDVAKALADPQLSAMMKSWSFVHCFTEGLPVEALLAFGEIKQANPRLDVSFFGPERFEDEVFLLPESKVIELLGPLAGDHEFNNISSREVRVLVERLSAGDDVEWPSEMRPVPADKLDYNEITGSWRHVLQRSFSNTPVVDEYFDGHYDPTMGQQLALEFSHRYQDLKLQNLGPSSTLTHLLEYVVGRGSVNMARQVAGNALLAYFFERCDIFERPEVR